MDIALFRVTLMKGNEMKRKSLKTRIMELPGENWEKEVALKLLPYVKDAIGGKGRIYAKVETVSRSGMSRTIQLMFVYPKDKSIVNLNDTIFAQIYGDWKRQGTVRIHGCGMDMLFEATYRLYQFLFDQDKRPYQKHLVRYSQY